MRAVWRWSLLEELAQNVRYALRGFRANPGLTAVIVTSLALGIGANTAIFSLVYSVMLRDLPVAHPEQLVELLQKYPEEPRGNGYWSLRSYEHYRDNNRVFTALTGAAIDNAARARIERSESVIVAEFVIGNYFSMLGVKPALGRLIDSETGVVVISWAFWNSRYHRDPAVLGKRIFVNDSPALIIGVAPAAFNGLRMNAQTELWLPAEPKSGLNLLGRLKPGVTLDQARADMTALFHFTIEERSAGNSDPQVRKLRIELESARAGLADVRDRVSTPLSVLMALVAALLLLACMNVAGLLLARGASRSREMSLRLGLGASRGRLIRQVLTESLLLSAIGAAAGGVLAYYGTGLLLQILDSGRPHERVHLVVRPDLNLFLFAVGIAVLAGLLFGLVPAFAALRHAPIDALRQSGRAPETRLHRVFGRSLVALQVVLSVVLLSLGGLFISHLADLNHADLGFRRDRILLVTLDPSRSGYRGEQLSGAYRELLDRIKAVPGVRSVSISAPTPLHGAGASGVGAAEGFDEGPENRRRISISYVSPGYFQTLSIPLFAGREFRFGDQSNPPVAIVNQSLAQHFFAKIDPVGKRITLDHVTGVRDPVTYEIIGVSRDANYKEIREMDRRAIYLPAFRNGRVTAGDAASLTSAVRRAIEETVPALEISKATTLTEQIDSSIVPQRLLAALSGFFAALGALLAAISVYGLLAYTVTRRTNEIGIRVTLGATRGLILSMIVSEVIAIAGAGLILGAPAAWWSLHLAAALVPDLTTHPAEAILPGAAALLAIVLLASGIPTWRAVRLDPMDSLRHE